MTATIHIHIHLPAESKPVTLVVRPGSIEVSNGVKETAADVAARIRQELQRLVEGAEPHPTESAYHELALKLGEERREAAKPTIEDKIRSFFPREANPPHTSRPESAAAAHD